jgi:hypothetical protein
MILRHVYLDSPTKNEHLVPSFLGRPKREIEKLSQYFQGTSERIALCENLQILGLKNGSKLGYVLHA